MGLKHSKHKFGSSYKDNAPEVSSSQTGSNEIKDFETVHVDRVNCLAVCKPGVCLSGSSDTVKLWNDL